MTMQSNYLVTGDSIYTSQGLKEQVMNYNDWAGAEITPTSFVLMNALGSVEACKNSKFLINDTIGTKRQLTAAADVAVAAPGSSVEIDIATKTDATSNNEYRVGMGFRIEGYYTDTTQKRASALILIVAAGPGGGWICKTLYTSTGAGVTFNYDSTEGTTMWYFTDIEDVNGAAPEASSWFPTQRYNWMQMYRIPWGVDNDMESQDKYFGNERASNQKEAESLLYGAIEHDILFSTAPMKQGSDESGGAKGTGSDKTVMGGIPYLLGTTDLSASAVKSHSVNIHTFETGPASAANGLEIINGLYDWADKFDTSNEPLLGLTSKNMRSYIRRSLGFQGDLIQPGVLQFPDLAIHYDQIDLGHIKLRLVVSDELSKGMFPYIYAGSGTNYVHKDLGIFALNMKHAGVKYRERKDYGIMAPRDLPLMPLRNELKYESEMVAECSVGLEHRHKHGVFYLYDGTQGS